MSTVLYQLSFRRIAVWTLMLAVVSCLSPGSTWAAGGNPFDYYLRFWKTDSGLPDNAVTAIVQTPDGYLWLGTYGGLARFDGARFTIYNSAQEPGLQSDRITSLSVDPDGTLWIGHERGDLTSYRRGHFEAQNVREMGVRRKISAIAKDAAGDVWMLNEEGTLLRVRDGATCALPNTDGVAEMARTRDGTLWISSGGRLGTLKGGRLHTNDPAVYGSFIQGLCESRDGGIWVVSDDLVKKWNNGVVTEDRGTNPCHVVVTSMLETHSGCLALGTSSDGLYLLFTNRSVLHFNHANGFPNDWIRCLAEDREGTLWVGAGSAGVIALRSGKIQTLEATDNWRGRVILSASVARDGTIWVGSEGAGLYEYLNHHEWKIYGAEAGLSNLYVWSVSQDQQGRIWAATWGGGIFVQQDDHFVRPPGLENVTVPMAATLQAPDGATWIGTANGLIRYQNGSVKWYGENDGLKLPDVRAITEAPDGTVWFGMLGGGLGRLRDGVVTQFQKGSGLTSDYVQCLKLESNEELWIGTYGAGLNRLKNGKFSKITTAEGLPNNFICAIEDDNRGNFWISSHNGIFCVPKQSLEDCADGRTNHLACITLGKGDGLPSVECSGGLQPAACKLADGRICFPTSKGLAVLNVKDTQINELPPPVVIEEVWADDQLLTRNPEADVPLTIQPGQQRFEFDFTGLSFVAPEKMRFQYQLANWDHGWENANSKRAAYYSYLPPGRYTFHVRACNSDGVWNMDGASLELVVLPHFWQTWWFFALEGLLGAASVANVVWYISRRRMRHKLDAAQRLQAIERERTRIAKDIHDHLGANLTRISLLSQSAHGELENLSRAAAQLDRIYETSRELTRAMDEIVWAVNPQHDTLDSLASYLGNFAQDYLGSIGLRCRLDVPLQLPHWPITAETRHNVFLAFKEALHNIVKHSGANEVSVILVTDQDGFQLVARDNGKGFDPTAVPVRPGRGNGLKNMAQRLEKIGGRFEIHASPNTGTEVRFFVLVPLSTRKNL